MGLGNILKFICAVGYISCVVDLVISDHFTLAGFVTMRLHNSKHVWECDINVCNYVCVMCTCAGSPGVGVQRQHTPSVGDQSAQWQLCAGGSEGVLHGEQVSLH